MPPNKDAPGLRTPGIYKIPCECGKVYIGQTVTVFHHISTGLYQLYLLMMGCRYTRNM
jgi:hypothetical protein